MSFVLLRSSPFIRKAQKTVKKQPELTKNLQKTLELLSEDPFHPRLRSHKLKGDLKDSYACSVSYNLRIIFKFVEYEQKQAILLETMGNHDEVY
ncbi:type II toxin-antitoxin system RelE/ParE family toxin [Crocosphaera chwakensis]|uniref:Plasmid stabilization system n=1 Tax=Crocosphaera chwakensis CCY0110 TaxID=391612 RepID=A3IN46_9CHRO|nr:type II toxin-antitoxin system mRNA interferase toxin, RelE/StbE family [Crocosphaera chwakensis]EAZ92023.1 Plasmid stabilization system [Crocosphaera chwakensis CCY0110]